MASHGRRGVADDGLHRCERDAGVHCDGHERMPEGMESGGGRASATPFKHHASRYIGPLEDPIQLAAHVPAARGEFLRNGTHDESAARLGRHLVEKTGELRMERDRDGASGKIAARLARDDPDNGRGEVHCVPGEAAAVAEPHARVDGYGEQHVPFASAGFGGDEKTAHLLKRQLAPRVAVAC